MIWFLETVKGIERLVFDPQDRATIVSAGPPGVIAATVLETLQDDRGDRTRIARIFRTHRLAPPRGLRFANGRILSAEVSDTRCQLAAWFATGKIRWNPAFDIRAVEAGADRPATHVPADLLCELQWRGPDAVASDSFPAIVLASAVAGALGRTLYACVNCRRLLLRAQRGPAWRRKRCENCRVGWKSGRTSDVLRREVRWLKERARRKVDLEKRRLVGNDADAILSRYMKGAITQAMAVREVRLLLPPSGRGRPRKAVS